MAKKINKAQAKKRIAQGETVYMLPSNIRFDNSWITPLSINNDLLNEYGMNLEQFINEYAFYNCNYETGYHVAWYIEEV